MGHRYYMPDGLSAGRTVMLGGEEHHHLSRVMRLKEGDAVVLFDGKGLAVRGKILDVSSAAARIETEREPLPSNESPLRAVLLQALPKLAKIDYVIEKAVELGVSEIRPVFTSRCDVKPGGGSERKAERWRRIAVAAAKQCERAALPAIHEAADFSEALAQVEAERKFILHPDIGENESFAFGAPAKSVALAVGPEGGFTDEEVALARECGFETLSLGPRILRTETAGLAALAVLQSAWGDFLRRG